MTPKKSAGAVVASPRGFFAWWVSAYAPAYDGDDDTFRSEPHFSPDPDCARIYTRRASAGRAALRIGRACLFPVAVVDLEEVSP